MINLRYHHLLCLYYFKGFGYDEKFINNMGKIKAKYQNEEINLVTSFDDLCKSCPNKVDGLCRWEDKVIRYDNNMKNIIEKGNNILYSDIEDKIKEIINDKNRLHICDDCKWNEYCK